MTDVKPYKTKNKIRIVTATSLFDGHDASINIMRRILQASGAEIIHLGHNRSVQEIVDCAIQEDVQAIAITSYQGGHLEFFKYMFDLLKEKQSEHVKIFGGGGGVILPKEIEELHNYGICRIFTPDDGRHLSLQGMINHVLEASDFIPIHQSKNKQITFNNTSYLAHCISALENDWSDASEIRKLKPKMGRKTTPVIGISGTGGAGKSSLIDELIRRINTSSPTLKIAIISVDPSRRKSGGALLGDRIRMNSINHENIFMRSMATRGANLSLSAHIGETIALFKQAEADLIILETSGIGQSDTQIVDFSDLALYVMTPEYGAPSQLEKIDMLDFADMVVLNKSDKNGAIDALRDVKKQVWRNRQDWDKSTEDMPVYLSNASHFFDIGLDKFYDALQKRLTSDYPDLKLNTNENVNAGEKIKSIIPGNRKRYLAEISETVRNYNSESETQSKIAGQLYALKQSKELLQESNKDISSIDELEKSLLDKLNQENKDILDNWTFLKQNYQNDVFQYTSRGKTIDIITKHSSLSQTKIPKIAVPKYNNWEDILRWQLKENFPGFFPYAAGVFPFKRENEDPTRMFAGEGSPERTNKRFHYLSKGQKAKRLSTAFDSVTLYGENPHSRPDIYGKIGNSGVSTATLDDIKKLYSGFDLCHQLTSVSMTINGPAPILMAFFLNAAIDQQCEKELVNSLKETIDKKLKPSYHSSLPDGNDGLGLKLLGVSGDRVIQKDRYEEIITETLKAVRGTVQADILKEDQAQNTCIFSVDFSLKLMGDVQEYFTQNNVQNFYSVSISGYHIAEAGANPITQLALTLANGFTYVEYYLSRGMNIDDFAPNLSFFFSNGIDPEFSVIGRVARIIWAKAIKYKYGGNSRSQKLKYHIQTSGRSLHAQEIEFNDIRTTLQALYAIYDNCNSLHTNAYDEAITTPTEESVRRALAIQLIINQELGLNKNQNPLQGSFIIEELTEIVEEAVLSEFDRLNERGGVLGAMETNYQRSKIQEESLHYEQMKNNGKLPLVGVNTFLSKSGSETILPKEVIRSSNTEKENQISELDKFHLRNKDQSLIALEKLKAVAINNENVFAELMETVKYCSLGQITKALYEVGGQYRRNM
ncbi:methylmalonyl-CoA mutase family protein [Carboxylicivirga sp. N1Y90]|uniref:methylmalonyl-CoA mutase family protein n=1 Tax=Carboxylicivirga fragile TaxID=3417571 RepID=UPI003D34E6BE|nr:methylmalonyl-CoA mutase family protein [Marinilabiliaceae bacterium N1Y90]